MGIKVIFQKTTLKNAENFQVDISQVEQFYSVISSMPQFFSLGWVNTM